MVGCMLGRSEHYFCWGMGIEDGSAQGHIYNASCIFMHGETLQLNCRGQAYRWMFSKSFQCSWHCWSDLSGVGLVPWFGHGGQRQGHGVGSFWVLLGCQVQTCKPIKSNESMSNLKSAVFTSFQSASNPSNLSGNLSHPFATPGSESWGQSHWLRPEDFRPVCQTPESIKTVWKEPRAETRSHYWWRQTHLSPEISIYIHTWCIFPDYAWLKLGIAVLPFEEPGGWGREVKPIINPESGDSFFLNRVLSHIFIYIILAKLHSIQYLLCYIIFSGTFQQNLWLCRTWWAAQWW